MLRAIAIVWAVVLALPPLPECCRPGAEAGPRDAAVGCHGEEVKAPAPSEAPLEDPCPCCDGCCDCAAAPALLGLSTLRPVEPARYGPTARGGPVPPWIHETLERPPSRRIV